MHVLACTATRAMDAARWMQQQDGGCSKTADAAARRRMQQQDGGCSCDGRCIQIHHTTHAWSMYDRNNLHACSITSSGCRQAPGSHASKPPSRPLCLLLSSLSTSLAQHSFRNDPYSRKLKALTYRQNVHMSYVMRDVCVCVSVCVCVCVCYP